MVKEYFSAVLYRTFLCWGCLAALALFVVVVDAVSIVAATDAAIGFDVALAVYVAYLATFIIAAINIPLIWAVFDAAYCRFVRRQSRVWRYVWAFTLGLIGSATIYLALTEQFPNLFPASRLVAWVSGLLWAWYGASLEGTGQFSAGGALTYIFGSISYVVCVAGAFSPVLATYIDRQRTKSST